MRKIQFTNEALFDIEDIVLWYQKQRIGFTYDFELCLEIGAEEILKHFKKIQKG